MSDLRKEYGEDARDEILQAVGLKLMSGSVIRMFRARAFSDGHIAAYIMKAIRHTITDLHGKRDRETARFTALVETPEEEDQLDGARATTVWSLADLRLSPEAELENKELSKWLGYLTAQLSERQNSILTNHNVFGGEIAGQELAVEWGVSIQTIHKDVSRIRKLFRAAALNSGYFPLHNGWERTSGPVAKRQVSLRNGEQDNVTAR